MSDIAAIAARHGFSEDAAQAAVRAMERSGGAMAQFDHPELGGMGQWSRGGMLMIGAMSDDRLKGRVRGLLEDLAGLPRDVTSEPDHEARREAQWWPESLGTPASSGGQNGVRYAVFPDARRLAAERDGKVTVHDTGSRRLSGVSQQQGATSTLRFSGPDGEVDLDDLPVVR